MFDPRYSPEHRDVPAEHLIVYNRSKRVRQLRGINPETNQMSLNRHTVVVSIDGACRGNGTPSARAAWGVYFGPQSLHNSSGILDAALPQTSTRAEIEALSQALDIIHDDISKDFSLLDYYIRTDSSYLAQTFPRWIQNWIDNGGWNSQGKRVAHFDTLVDIDERLEYMSWADGWGLSFDFWQVPREENTEADALANDALDKAYGANRMAANARPRILSVSLNPFPSFDSMYGSLFTRIQAVSTFRRVENGQSAIRRLLEDPRPDVVLITDEAITWRENAAVWDAALQYVRQGGTAVVMGDFPYFVRPRDINRFFAEAGLDWKEGSYHRTTLVLNHRVVGAGLASRLLPEYSQRAVLLEHAKPSHAWYVTDECSVIESFNFSESAHNPGESAVLLARVGQGKLGYIGDVNGEEGSEAVVMAMCGL